MKWLNKTATSVMDRLTDGLVQPGDNKVFDAHGYSEKWDGGIMAVHVEHIGYAENQPDFPLFSVAHYYKQFGDMMRDPEMVFLRFPGNKYIPISYEQSGLGIYQTSVSFSSRDYSCVQFKSKMQADQASFANTWMKNIREQQNL